MRCSASTRRLAILLCQFSVACVSPCESLAAATAPAVPEERIRRVEQGLRPGVIAQGETNSVFTLGARMEQYRVPGVSIAVINEGRIDWARGYGVAEAGSKKLVTTETLFQAASISKPVTALAVLRLVEKGRLNLDGDLNRKLVSWKVPENDFTREKHVSLRMLLSHTAGLTVHGFAGYESNATPTTLLQVLDGEPPANSQPIRVDALPGSRWRYSGGGYCVMQQLILDLTRQPFPQFMHDTVLKPLDMDASTFEQPLPVERSPSAATGHRANGTVVLGRWHVYPEMAAAGLWTTPSDLARFSIELQRTKAGESRKIISRTMATQMLTAQKETGDPRMPASGLGIFLEGSGASARFLHAGANEGFRCQLVGYVYRGKGAVVMTNSDNGARLIQEVFWSIAREYDWPDYPYTPEITAP
jgi:CubicO group peptidase (beta-lactamase class C family)